MSRRAARSLAVALSAAALAACGGESPKPFSSLEGIYSIGEWTENPNGCDLEGPSVLDQQADRYLWLKVDSFYVRYLGAVTCTDLPTCRSDALDAVPLFGAWIFFDGGDTAGWTGRITYASSVTATTCTGGILDERLEQAGAGNLVLRLETRVAPEFPVNGSGICDTHAAEAAAAPTPCASLEVLRASYVEALP